MSRLKLVANTKFNQDISGCDTANATGMVRMFQFAGAFDQSLDSWNVSSDICMSSLFENAVLPSGRLAAMARPE